MTFSHINAALWSQIWSSRNQIWNPLNLLFVQQHVGAGVGRRAGQRGPATGWPVPGTITLPPVVQAGKQFLSCYPSQYLNYLDHNKLKYFLFYVIFQHELPINVTSSQKLLNAPQSISYRHARTRSPLFFQIWVFSGFFLSLSTALFQATCNYLSPEMV